MSKIKPSLLQEVINKLVRSGLPITMIRQDKLPTIARLEGIVEGYQKAIAEIQRLINGDPS